MANRLLAQASTALFSLFLLFSLLLAVGVAHAAEPSTAPQLRIEGGMHTGQIRSIAADPGGRWAVTAGDDKSARVWDLASGRIEQVLRPPIGQGHEGKLFAVAISPDGATVAAAGSTGPEWNGQAQVYLFDRASGRLLRRLAGMPEIIVHLAFSPDGRWLAATLGDEHGIRAWDLHRDGPPFVDASYGAASYGASWSADGRLVVASLDGKLRLYRSGAGGLEKLLEARAPGGKGPFGVAFSPDGTSIAVGYQDAPRVDVLDAATLELRFSPDMGGVHNGRATSVAWSRDGRTLAATGMLVILAQNGGGRPGWVRRWGEAGRGAPFDSIVSVSRVAGLVALPDGAWLAGTTEPSWGVLSAQGQWHPRGVAPIANLWDSLGPAFMLADGGRSVQFGFEGGGRAAHRFALRSRTLAPGALDGATAARVTGLNVSGWEGGKAPKLDGQALPLDAQEQARSLAIAADHSGFVLGSEWALRHFARDGKLRWKLRMPGAAMAVQIAPGDKFFAAAYADGTIRWHRLSDGRELLAFFPHADRKRWVLWTPSGYYDASPGGEDLIGWHVNRGQDQAADFFPASQFRERFNRPDVIDRVLDTLDESVAVADADKERGSMAKAPLSVAQVLPPVVELPGGTELRSGARELRIAVRARSAADAPVTAWRVRVNGQSVPEVRGLGRQDGGERELTVPIPAHDSQVQIFAENRHGVSVPATLRVGWTGAAAGADKGFQIKPKLYVLAVGVGAYQHKDITPLALAAKDARDFAGALGRQQGGLYREVEVKLLVDAQATADALVDGLEWLQRSVTQHDVGMVFIAGHGVNDPTQGYTFLPVNADPERLRRTGVAMDEFKKTLAGLPGKAVFFLDTCHSGNVLGAGRRSGANDVSGVINELASAENGVVVFSSSTGRQFSLEDPAWGNGAFTKALVEGLNGAADYQKNGRITHKMLDLYVSERVKQLTGGRQSPVTQAPGGVPDFPLALTK
ncbi:MAG: caspase family protein [Pseudomonadota bacterium]